LEDLKVTIQIEVTNLRYPKSDAQNEKMTEY
jgi:hypothetical protein